MLFKSCVAAFGLVLAFQAAAAPATVDWRARGVVTPVKNEGQCGASWAFAATGAIEGHAATAGHGLHSLSEQQLIDCSVRFGNLGCSGGLVVDAFKSVIAHGSASESSYPYQARDGSCKAVTAIIHITGHHEITKNSEEALKEAVARQPVAVAVDASNWPSYKGGVFSGPCGKQLNHFALVVGYTHDYWIVKNDWGTSWGEHGYIRLARGKNICGIAEMASYPTG